MDGGGGDEGDEEVDEHCGMHRKGWPVGAAGDDHLGSGFLKRVVNRVNEPGVS